MGYTIGAALTDAHKNGFLVELLVEGHWIHGEVAAVDGFGVVLTRTPTQNSVIRIESIAAINIDEDKAAADAVASEVPRQLAGER